ncbi:bifunctional diaminohydroxyphosphoribosylaminopyrimidine deaminase/5-amino-6-(5-phosphoribosylamino)uracil reductase RibD [Methylobrevis albus]|uniref:Riboflavin biosynthesis protein RibD n=1 Tax=Methylobrevis albus TaxID=2793297 RepID=A0A931I5J7_9HYPH|nr:bifunctional diaminohydroxyphosphoribosylaminopyrimidine deaminase/5-amino-6-(5-phosphoribosylamino)uracil reductase RibD [Methylobrevis albus]MBH0239984.1 bifunctional diaminohydroxyphosphoribosylaminopyrimidine deaminase/5-amino-6-(5-phosphoribosylamino)uracil reductase RibD [Methylobrevis albus]
MKAPAGALRGGVGTPADVERDRRFMAAALAFGWRNQGLTWPNPSVGAILVQTIGGVPVVVGRGVTGHGGRPHAEAVAIAEAGEAARGATAYVTLEPCAHVGRGPPCADALITARVGRVVTAMSDPDPRVADAGHARIAAAGIPVTTGVLAAAASLAHAGHLSRVTRFRPHVCLKFAVSADGAIGRQGAGQVPISGALSRAYAHVMRAEHDAILVGIGTALADDPQLTCRLPGMMDRTPVRVVIDAEAALPVTSFLVRSAREHPVMVFVGSDAPPERVAALFEAGVAIRVADRLAGRIDLADVLFQLSQHGLGRIMVEGGARLAAGLLEADLVDEAVIVRTPFVVGADPVVAFPGPTPETGPGGLVAAERRRLGDDLMTRYVRPSFLKGE